LTATLRKERTLFTGTADEVIAQIKSYAAVGAEELMLQWLDLDDIDGLRAFAEQVLPHV